MCLILPAMQKLIKISNHLSLLRPRPADTEDRQEFDSILWETLTEGEEQAELDQSYVNESLSLIHI